MLILVVAYLNIICQIGEILERDRSPTSLESNVVVAALWSIQYKLSLVQSEIFDHVLDQVRTLSQVGTSSYMADAMLELT